MVRQVLCLLGLEALVPDQPPNVRMKRRPTDEKAPQFLDAVPPLEADDVFVSHTTTHTKKNKFDPSTHSSSPSSTRTHKHTPAPPPPPLPLTSSPLSPVPLL